MTPILRKITLAALVALPIAAPAQALPPLAENERIVGEFFSVAVGDAIRKNCGSVSARMLYVLRKASELEDYALSLGYTESDIEEMRSNPANKARLRAMRDQYLAENGVVAGDEESYCRLGRKEIDNNTFIGSLLRAR